MSDGKVYAVIGAGPAGLAAAHELAVHCNIAPLVIEASNDCGGISKTVNYRGNRLDIGGHRFFTKSSAVMRWWLNILPVEQGEQARKFLAQWPLLLQTPELAFDREIPDGVMLVRSRRSRIMFERRLLDYPLSMSPHLVRALGIQRLMAIGGSYLLSRFAGKKPIVSMEDFYTARFGRALFETFFKTYTEKVWGLPCSELAADWGAQRIRGLSAGKVLMHALNVFRRSGGEISLAEEFLYPEKGPGQLWETAGGIVENHGGEIRRNCLATKVLREGNRIAALRFRAQNGSEHTVPVRALFSSMALRDLIGAIEPAPPDEVIRVARALPYRNFITVGLLLSRLWCVLGKKNEVLHRLPDNWIYVQDPSVRLGRIQFPKNWSPAMVDDPRNEWISLEYFCSGGDSLWSMSDQAMIGLGIDEIGKVGIARREDVVDACVVRMPDAYPVYSGAYKNLAVIRDYLDGIDNLYPIGRNGLHRYNNQDHSVMTGLIAARLAREGSPDKKKIWDVNTEQEYCEER